VKNSRKARCVAVILFLGLLTGAAFPQENVKLVSVFPFQTVGVSKPDAVTLTSLFETALVNTRAVRVVEQTEVEKYLRRSKRSLSVIASTAFFESFGNIFLFVYKAHLPH